MSFLRKLPIKIQLMIIIISTLMTMLLIMLLSYIKITGILTINNKEYSSQIISQIRNNVASNCDEIDRIITSVAYNPLVQDYLNEEDEVKKFEIFKKLDATLIKTRDLKEGILDIVIIDNNGNCYSTIYGGSSEAQEINAEFPDRVKAYYTDSRDYNGIKEKTRIFLAGTAVYSIDEERIKYDSIGIVALYIDCAAVSSDIGEISKVSGTKFYLIDRENKVFSSNDSVQLGSKFDKVQNLESYADKGQVMLKISGKTNFLYVERLPEIGGYIVGMIPESALLSALTEVQKWALTVFAVAVLLISFPFTFVTNNILRPVKRLLSFIYQIKAGNLKSLKKQINLEGYSEMTTLAHEFNGMLDEINSLTHRLIDTNTRLYETELLKKDAELAFLKSQINPHFLYNTLESIKSIANLRGVSEVSEMSKALAHIFRYSINGDDVATLAEELEIVKAYITIQQIRFGDRFSVEYSFPEDTLGYRLIRMVLQPIVENAIYHGLEPKLDPGHLVLTGKLDANGDLLLIVKDDGVGMDEEKLNEIRSKLSKGVANIKSEAKCSTEIGLMNVNNRICMTYGNDYGIQIASGQDTGTEVLVRVPGGR